MEDLIKRSKAIDAIHNYWKKRLETLPTTMSEYGEVYADTREMDKMLEHNRTLCNFINAIPSADRPQGMWELVPCTGLSEYFEGVKHGFRFRCSNCKDERKWNKHDMNYCPNYGARMKGADDE